MASITIVDVAKQAGVSIKTVSRVLNNAPTVRPAVRARVDEAMRVLHYRPNPGARSLAGSRSYLIALLYLHPVSDYIGKLQQGVVSRCREAGYHVLLEPLDMVSDEMPQVIADILARVVVDGFILVPPLSDNPAVLAALDRAGTPYVRISPETDAYRSAFVDMNHRAAAAEMTRHLIGLGHRRIALIAGDPAHAVSHRRREGYGDALLAADIAIDPTLIHQGDFTSLSGYAAAEELLKLPNPPTAIFASNDAMALGVLALAHRMKLSVPEDLSVAGFDDSALSTSVSPQLTTVRQLVAEMASAAAGLLIEGKAGELDEAGRAVSRMFEFTILVRESTASPSTRTLEADEER